ncbi:MAG: YfjI family protein [Chlamydiota bacterium]
MSIADQVQSDQEFSGSEARAEELCQDRAPLGLPAAQRPEPFPFDALGVIPGAAARKLHEMIKAADSVCGLSVLTVLALAAQGYVNVDVGYGAKPISLFGLTIAESGERKSAVDKVVLLPIREWQKMAERTYYKNRDTYELNRDFWDKQKKAALAREDAESGLLQLPQKPLPPLVPYMICEEPTYEGLVRLLAEGQPIAGLFTDEGARLVGGYALNNDNMLKTAAGLSSLWDAGEISRVRAEEGASVHRGKRLSVHLMLQEVAFQKLTQGAILEKQGLLSRFLIVQPQLCAGSRIFVDGNPVHTAEVKALLSLINTLLDQPLPIDKEAPLQNELIPLTLECNAEVKCAWVDYYNEVEFESGPEGKYALIRSFASKSAEQAYRIAAVLAVCEGHEISLIPLEQMKNGITLARYFLHEALRIFSSASVSAKVKSARLLLDWLVTHPERATAPGVFSIRTLQLYGPNALRDKKPLQEAIDVLVEHQCLVTSGNKIVLQGAAS